MDRGKAEEEEEEGVPKGAVATPTPASHHLYGIPVMSSQTIACLGFIGGLKRRKQEVINFTPKTVELLRQ